MIRSYQSNQQFILIANRLLTSIACLSIGVQACTITEPLRTEPFESGIMVFDNRQQGKPGSVSFINRQSGLVRFQPPKANVLSTDIFNNINDRPLADSVFSCTEIDGKDFLVVPAKDAIELVEGSTFRSISPIGGAENGRYVVGLNSLKAYVSCWGGKTLSPNIGIIDITERSIVGRIPVSAGPEQMAIVGNELFVANSGSGLVSIINTNTDQLVTTIPVGDVPTSISYDATTSLLYVLCAGKLVNASANGLTTAELIRIDPAMRKVVSRVLIGGRPIAGNPSQLVLDAQTQTLYFLWRGNIYRTAASATSIPVDRPVVSRVLTNFGFDPATATLYGATRTRPVVLRYQASGTLIDSIITEAIPRGFYIK